MGGVLGRLAAYKLRKQGKLKVIYTAHGFHFYTGAPLVNWLVYYPVEKLLARCTDVIITINEETTSVQSNHSEIHKIDGVGVDLNRFQPCGNLSHRLELRHRLGFKETDFIVTVVAELNKNKNQIVLVKAALVLKAQIPCLKVLLIGKETAPDVRRYVDAHSLNDVVLFLGYRNDVEKYFL